MRVAKALVEAGFSYLSPSSHYEDPIERGKFREIDLVAQDWRYTEDGKAAATCAIFVECKHAELPWVVFSHQFKDDEQSAGQGVLSRVANELGHRFLASVSGSTTALNNAMFSVADRLGTRVTQPSESGKSGWGKPARDPHDAVEQVLSAARAEAKVSSDPSQRGYLECEVIFPLIVVGGDLFDCHFDAEGEPTVEEVEWAQLLRFTMDARHPILIDIVTEKFLDSYLEDEADSVKGILDLQMIFLNELQKQDRPIHAPK